MTEPQNVNHERGKERIDARKMTWAVLLGRWVEFARSSVALPAEGHLGKLKESVVDLITLQAVIAALSELDQLPDEEQALGLDRAEVLVETHSQAVKERFERAGSELPDQIRQMIDEAHEAIKKAKCESSFGTNEEI